MKLTYNKKADDPIYYIQHGIRIGKKTTSRTIKRIGKHSELLKITNDPLAYAKNEVKKCSEEYNKNKISFNINIDLEENVSSSKDRVSKGTTVNIGYFPLQQIYHEMGISKFFNDLNKKYKSTYKFNDINRFLTYSRILNPKSKLGTFDDLKNFFEEPDIKYEQIMRFLDVLEENSNEYIKALYECSKKTTDRNLSVCYLDYTNYFFEIHNEDDDFIDEKTGEIIKGLRKYGVSKEHKPNPIVQMGLFMDYDGLPITMSINSGSDNENKNALPLERELLKTIDKTKFIYCADAGLNSLNLRKYNSLGGRAFVVSQSVKQLSKDMQDRILNDYDYKLLGSNKNIYYKDLQNNGDYSDVCYKVFYVDKTVDLGLFETKYINGKLKKVKTKSLLPQKLIVTFSKKSMMYQRKIRDRQIKKAEQLIADDYVEKSKKGLNDSRRFIKRSSKVINNDNMKTVDVYSIDLEKIRNEEKFDGFYAIATNLDDDIEKILDINKNRYKIEECFRVLKSNFSTRPIFHYLPNRISAHFLVCFTALLLFRILQKKLNSGDDRFTVDEIIKTLKTINVSNNKNLYYEAQYTGSETLNALESTFNLRLNKKNHDFHELRKKIKIISK